MKPPRPPKPLPGEKLATQTLLALEERTGWTRRQTLTIVGAAALMLVICLGSTFIALGQVGTPPPTATFVPLPVVSAADVLARLKALNVPIQNVQTVNPPGALWKAKQEIQFEVQRGKDKATFLLLSYETPSQAGADAFAATNSDRYRQYTLNQFSNVLIAASPESAPPVVSEINNAMMQLLITPYRSFLLTPTKTP